MIEGLSLENVEYYFVDPISSDDQEKISKTLSAIDGIESTKIHDGSASIQYYTDILSKEMIRGELNRLGVSLGQNNKTSNPFKRFVNRLAESNTKTFGSEPLDCCNLNNKQRIKG
jgi:hypothetical protein